MMKDVYELLNEMDINENEFEEMEVSEIERAKVKRALRNAITPRKKRWTRNTAAAVLAAGLSVIMLGMTFPAYANSIPGIDNIFRLLGSERSGLFDHYKTYSSEMNLAEKESGITITINDALFDGETVFLTYALESDQDLGVNPTLHGLLDIKGANGLAGSNQLTRVGHNKYVGLVTGTGFGGEVDSKTANVKWSIDSIVNQDGKAAITGDWHFALKLMATESMTQQINRSTEHNGVTVQVDKLSVTPMSFILYFNQAVDQKLREQWEAVDVGIKVKDNLGHRYTGQGNGGAGDKEGYNMNWSKTFEALDPNASQLIITPLLSLYDYTSENHGSMEMTRDGSVEEASKERVKAKSRQEYVLEDIVIDLRK
ncbi:DUF4179 domain-containing protein [Paenibacillus glycanilyticus]|uniref:DUF4179 domain-containing protein n=1 Tax=Paenibacillus glycanilyticus TaxID=126569 RepID=UPI002041DD76|nr:DUF4179 domain-containing protein [Paenibacillus glycanilyticus]MCM3626991.1 DUF4179 domain-containing protein [Paenibacillus glycanilyticus]